MIGRMDGWLTAIVVAELTRRRAEWSGGLTVGGVAWGDAAAGWAAASPVHVRMLRCHLARVRWILPALPSGARSTWAARRRRRSSDRGTSRQSSGSGWLTIARS